MVLTPPLSSSSSAITKYRIEIEITSYHVRE
jgi:hypothetical protein